MAVGASLPMPRYSRSTWPRSCFPMLFDERRVASGEDGDEAEAEAELEARVYVQARVLG